MYAGQRKSYNASRPTGGPESTGACRLSSVTFAIKSTKVILAGKLRISSIPLFIMFRWHRVISSS